MSLTDDVLKFIMVISYAANMGIIAFSSITFIGFYLAAKYIWKDRPVHFATVWVRSDPLTFMRILISIYWISVAMNSSVDLGLHCTVQNLLTNMLVPNVALFLIGISYRFMQTMSVEVRNVNRAMVGSSDSSSDDEKREKRKRRLNYTTNLEKWLSRKFSKLSCGSVNSGDNKDNSLWQRFKYNLYPSIEERCKPSYIIRTILLSHYCGFIIFPILSLINAAMTDNLYNDPNPFCTSTLTSMGNTLSGIVYLLFNIYAYIKLWNIKDYYYMKTEFSFTSAVLVICGMFGFLLSKISALYGNFIIVNVWVFVNIAGLLIPSIMALSKLASYKKNARRDRYKRSKSLHPVSSEVDLTSITMEDIPFAFIGEPKAAEFGLLMLDNTAQVFIADYFTASITVWWYDLWKEMRYFKSIENILERNTKYNMLYQRYFHYVNTEQDQGYAMKITLTLEELLFMQQAFDSIEKDIDYVVPANIFDRYYKNLELTIWKLFIAEGNPVFEKGFFESNSYKKYSTYKHAHTV